MHLLLVVLAVVVLVGAVIATRAGRGHPPSTSRPVRVDEPRSLGGAAVGAALGHGAPGVTTPDS